MRKRMNRLLALFLSGTMFMGETLPVFAEEPVAETVQEEDSDEYEGAGDGEDFEFVPGYIDLPEDHDVPVVETGLSYGEMRAALEPVEEPDLFTAPQEAATESAYPAAYDGEWLAYLKDTFPATRNQNPYGSCWAHSSVFLAEAYLIRHGMASKDIDLSELHLTYWTYNNGTPSAAAQGSGDSVQSTEKAATDNKSILDYGGNLRNSSQTLMRQRGYALESVAPYSNAKSIAEGGTLAASTERQDSFYLTNAYEISIKSNAGLVKSAIRENGAVGVSYHSYPSSNKTYYNETNNAFWNPVDTSTNHAVILVGWDDNFPKENFNPVNGKLPENDGAWLVRNSWTTNTQASYKSYFWLSYEDTSLADSAWVFEADTAFPYDNHYYYDSQIYSTSSYSGSSVKKFANIYTVNGAAGAETETLEAVDFNVSNIGSTGSGYTVEIYKDLTGATPDTGTLASTTEGKVYFRGQYTVKLAEPVTMDRGSCYAVVVSFEEPTTSIALTRSTSGDGRYYSTTTHCEGKSYILYPGYYSNKWLNELSDYVIGALTVDGDTSGIHHVTGVSLNKNDLTLEEGAEETLIATVTPDEADDKSVAWESDTPAVATVDADGKVTAVKAGNAVITVTTTDGGYTASCSVTVKKAVVNVSGVSLDQKTLKLAVGESETLTATVAPENADDQGVTWTSSAASVATVDKSGKVTAVAAGEATITVKTNDGGYEAECVVTVSEDLQIRAVMSECTISVGMTMEAEVTVSPATAETPEFVYSSSDPTVASIDDAGEIKALSPGTTTIKIKTTDGKASTSFELTVVANTIDVTGIEIDQVSMKLTEGETGKLAAWVTPKNASNQNITFSSDDEDVAIVNKNGVVTAIGEGTTDITATSEDGGFSKTCKVTVTPQVIEVSGVSLDENELTLTVGDTQSLTATIEPEDATDQKISWSSDDKNVATVDANGRVTAVAEGVAKITVTTEDGGYTDDCWVAVVEKEVALTGLGIDPSEPELIVGDTSVLSAVLEPADATVTDLLWTSDNTDVVAIDSDFGDGVEITAVSAGTAIVTVTNTDKTVRATCKVTVKEAPVKVIGVSLDKEEAELTVAETLQLTATVEPEDAANQKVSWSSDDETVATVDADGKVTAIAEGTATITVTTDDGGYTAECEVTVVSGQEEPTPAPTPDYGEAPRVITQEDGSTVVYVKNQPVADYTGIAIFGTEEDAPWVYLEDGKRNQEYSGFVDYDGESFYVAGGTMASKQNGVQIDPNSGDDPVFYFVAGGMVQKHHEGLAEYDGAWFYIKDGKVQLEKNAFVEYDGGLFLVAVGRIVNEYAGLCQDPQNTQTGDWYFFSNGQAQTQYTGLALYDGHWFYVEKGKFLPSYTGTVWYDGEQFEVVNGEAVL